MIYFYTKINNYAEIEGILCKSMEIYNGMIPPVNYAYYYTGNMGW